MNEADVRRIYRFLAPAQEIEIRLIDPHGKPPKSIFTRSEEDFVAACKENEGQYNIYAGINERTPNGTKSKDVITVRTVVVDIDALRPDMKQAATKEELDEADKTASQITYDFLQRGFNTPMTIMSGNGYQLWFSIPTISISDENRLAVERKMQLFQREIIAKYSGAHAEIDNIGDLPRIIKVAGTLSIKGDNTPERPWRESAIKSANFDRNEDAKLRDYILMLEAPAQKETAKIELMENIDPETVNKMLSDDVKLNELMEGKWQKYGYPSRSEAEEAMVVKLIYNRLPQSTIFSLMMRCKIGKWQEENASYKKLTFEHAMKFCQENPQATWRDAVTKQIETMRDYIDLAEQLYKIQPFFFDRNGILWFWDKENSRWVVTDKTDVMNTISNACSKVTTTESKTKNEVMEAIEQVGRRNLPKDMPKTWVQFKNKIIDVATGEEFVPTTEWFCVNPIPWNVGDSSETPVMDRIMTEWVGEENIITLKEIVAYCLLPDYPINRLFCFVGAGSNGKGVCMRIIQQFVGPDNYTSTSLKRLSEGRFEAIRLYKKLVVFMGETNFDKIGKTDTIKRATGGDPVPVEIKGGRNFDIYNYAKFIISTNSLPITLDKTDGFYRRWLIIDFPNKFSEQKDILLEIPVAEYSSLARWCVAGLRTLIERRSFSRDGTVEERAKRYEDRSNPTLRFIAEECTKDMSTRMPFAEFYDCLSAYLMDRKYRILTKVELKKILEAAGFEFKTTTGKWNGVDYNGQWLLGVTEKGQKEPKEGQKQKGGLIPLNTPDQTKLNEIKQKDDSPVEIKPKSEQCEPNERFFTPTPTYSNRVKNSPFHSYHSPSSPTSDNTDMTEFDAKILNWRKSNYGIVHEDWLRSFLKMTDEEIVRARELGLINEVSPGRFELI